MIITRPCPLKRSPVHPGEQLADCVHCQRPVHNLAVLTHDEAQALVEQSDAPLCVHIEYEPDGRIRYRADVPSALDPLSALRRHAIGALLAASLSLGVIGCQLGKDIAHLDGDVSRSVTADVPLNRTIMDRLDRDQGDHDDWKRFNINGPGFIEVLILLDEPDATVEVRVIDSRAVQRDVYIFSGGGLKRLKWRHDEGDASVFLQLRHIDGYATDYTMQARFTPLILDMATARRP